jgi:hypothetical protein
MQPQMSNQQMVGHGQQQVDTHVQPQQTRPNEDEPPPSKGKGSKKTSKKPAKTKEKGTNNVAELSSLF